MYDQSGTPMVMVSHPHCRFCVLECHLGYDYTYSEDTEEKEVMAGQLLGQDG